MPDSEVVGRITIFHARKEGRMNEPDYIGTLTTAKGEFKISLWAELNGKVTNGEILKGSVRKIKEV